MESKLTNVLLNGSLIPYNIIDYLYFSWRLENVIKQESVELIIKSNDEIVFKTKQNSQNQYLEVNLKLKEHERYDYTLTINKSIIYENYFYSGLVNGFDNNALWISNGFHFVSDTKEIGNKALYFKKIINIEAVKNYAIVDLVGLGLFELKINDKKVGNKVLEPSFSEYDKLVLYSTYNVKKFLKEGINKIEVIVGDGWYNQTTIDTWGFNHAPWRDNAKLLFQLDIDGKKIYSDKSWEYSYGEITSNALRTGETHDFNAIKEYHLVSLTTPAGGILKPSYIEGISEVKEIAPAIIKKIDNKIIYDCYENMAGYCRITFLGKKGSTIKIIYSDRLVDNHLDNSSNSMYIFNENVEYQTDTCILSNNIDTYKPLFTYHGFRYVLIEGDVEVKDIKAYLIRTNFTKEGYFKSSNEILNKLYDMSIQAIESNYVDFPTDCPHREKNGWTGDAQLSLETSVYTFNMHQAYKKWLDDFKVAQRPCGQIPCIIPTCGWGFNWGSGPAWDVAMFRITDAMYYYYGDKDEVIKMYPHLEKYYNYLINNSNNYLVSIGLGDWNYPKNVKFEVCDTTLISSSYFMEMSLYLAKFSKLLNNNKEKYYLDMANKIKKAIIVKYSNVTSLTGLACLTYFNIINKTDEIVNYLIKNDFSLHMGILGVKYVFDSLAKNHRTDIGLKILLRKEYPSFRYWIDNNQTTLCEDFELTNSLNHHMFSPIAEFMIRGLMGANINDDGSINLKPNNQNISIDCKVLTCIGVYHFKINANKLIIIVPSNGNVYYKNQLFKEGYYEVEA